MNYIFLTTSDIIPAQQYKWNLWILCFLDLLLILLAGLTRSRVATLFTAATLPDLVSRVTPHFVRRH